MAHTAIKIGELARRTGLTVRALHHYEHIGLLVPSIRTGAGHRLYTPRDIGRLMRIVLLKRLGLPLEQVALCLDARASSLKSLLARHTRRLQDKIAAEAEMCRRLEKISSMLDSTGTVSVEHMYELMEIMHMMENYYTPEQLEQLKKRHEALGEEGIKAAEQEWPELMKKMTAEMEAGTDPADPRVQKLARRWKELVESFTGGDPGITRSLGKLWKEKGPELTAKMGMGFDPKLFEYAGKARALLKD